MKHFITICIFLFMIQLNDCKISSPCHILDYSCNPISSLILERGILESKNSLTFTPDGGSYDFDQFVSLFTSSPSAVIRYTTDGSEPTCSKGSIFKNPIPLLGVKTHSLRAAVCNENAVAKSDSRTYTVNYSPLSAANLRFWYSADSIGTQNGMDVTQWNDYSGNENHLYSNFNNESNPTLVANALNGKPSVRLTSSRKNFFRTKSMNSYTGTKAGVGILVLKKYSNQVEDVYFSIGNLGAIQNSRTWRGNQINQSICSSVSPAALNCAGVATNSVPLTDYHVIAFSMDPSGSIQYFMDNTVDGTGALAIPSIFPVSNTMFVGTGVNLSTFLDAEILEILFYEGVLKASSNSVICTIKYKYGLALPLTCL